MAHPLSDNMLGLIRQRILWQVKAILYHAAPWAAQGGYLNGPLQNAPKLVANGAVSFSKPKEYITANRTLYNRHSHARDAFEYMTFIFKAVF